MSNPFVNPGGTSAGSTDASIAAAAAASQAAAAAAAQAAFEAQTIASSAKSLEYLTNKILQLTVPGESYTFTNVLIARNTIQVKSANVYSLSFNANDDEYNYFILTDFDVRDSSYTSLYKTPVISYPYIEVPQIMGITELTQLVKDYVTNPFTSTNFTNVEIVSDNGIFFNDDNTYTFYFYGDNVYSYLFKIDNFDTSYLSYDLYYTGNILDSVVTNPITTPVVKFAFSLLTDPKQYIYALVGNTGGTGSTVKYTSNFGTTWGTSDLVNTISWIDIDASDDGKYVTVVAPSGQVYISSNYGVNWIKSNYPKAISWKFVNIIGDGGFQYISSNNSNENFQSTDYGQTWTRIPIYGPGSIKEINVSTNGQIIMLSTESNSIWYSNNYGSNYSLLFTIPAYNWTGIAFSYNNSYATIVADDGHSWWFQFNEAGQISANGETNILFGSQTFTGISITGDGRFQYAITTNGTTFASSDYGQTWSYDINNLFTAGNTGKSYIGVSYYGEYRVFMTQYGDTPGIFLSKSVGTTPYPRVLTPYFINNPPVEEDMKAIDTAMQAIYPDKKFQYEYNTFSSNPGNKTNFDFGMNNILNDYYNMFELKLYINPNYPGNTGSIGITGNNDTRFKYIISYNQISSYGTPPSFPSTEYNYIDDEQAAAISHVLKTHVLFTNSNVSIYSNILYTFYDYINDLYDVRFYVNDNNNITYTIYGLNLTNYSYITMIFTKTSTNVNIPLTTQFALLYDQLLATQPTYEILEFTKDNYNPINYSGNLVGSMEGIWYDIELLSVMVPNKPLKNAYNIGAFPYFYVVFHTQTLKNKNLLYSNNNSSSYASFIVRSITADTNNNFSYLTLSSTKQRIKFKPNEDLIFSIFQPNGKIIEFQQSDYFSPYPPIEDFQVSAVFNITKCLDDKSSKDTYSKMIEINSLRRNRNAYPNPASFTALFNQNSTLNTTALNALDPVYLAIPQYVFRTNSNRVTNTIRRVNSVSASDTSQVFLDKSESSVNSYLVGYNILLFYYGNGNVNSTPSYIYDRMIYGYNGVTQCATLNRSLPAVSGTTGQLPYSKNTVTYILYDKTFSSNYGFINKYGITGCTGPTGVPAGPTGITGSTGTILPINPNESMIPFTTFKTQITTTLPSANSRSVIIIDYPVPDPVAYPTKYYYPPAGFFDFCYITINIDGLDPGSPPQNNILVNTRKIINTEVDFSTTSTPTTLVLYLEQELNYIPQPGSICIINNVVDNLNLYPSVSTQFTDIYGTNNVRTESGYDNFYVDFLLENTLSREFQVIKSYKNIINLAETKSAYSYTNISDNMSDVNSYLNYDVVYTIRQQRPLDYMYVFPAQMLPTNYGIYDINNLPAGFSCDPPASIINYINSGSPNGLNYLVLDNRSFTEPRFYDNLYIRFTKNLDSNYDLTCRIVKYYPYMNIYDKNYDPPKLVFRQPIYMIEFDNYATATQQLQSNPGKILSITISSVSAVFKING